ncbi:unnamed protein product [Malus baccata var. baccata]
MMRRQQEQDQQSRVFYELSALVLNLLRSPPTPIQFSDNSTVMPPSSSSSSSSLRRPPAASTAQISPAGFASLMLGISMALMLCGSVTFFIGFLLMPWVLGLVMVLYVAGILWSLSVLGKSILCYASAPSTPRKDIPGEGGGGSRELICLTEGRSSSSSTDVVLVRVVLHIGKGMFVDVNANSDEEDGEEAEEDDGVDEDRYPARMHVPKLHHLAPSRQLEQQPRTQKHEQHHSYHHRPPIRHSIFTIYEMIFLLFLLLCVQV